jgi:phosphatidylserine/phosphatidylglycerophosphate/cardiolipin synthase-like enzyme
MKILTTPWKADLLELVHQSKKTIKITSPFLKNNVCNELLHEKNDSVKLELITSFKLMSVYSGSLDLAAIESILDRNGVVKNYSKLHSKIYLFDDTNAIITSANLTNGGLLRNFEYGIQIDEKNIVKQIAIDYNYLSKNENTGIIRKSHLSTVKEILYKIPKTSVIKIPNYEIETPEENFDIIDTPSKNISSSLDGWKLDVFNFLNNIPKQVFDLKDVYFYQNELQQLHPKNNRVKHKIRQQLQFLRDFGLLEFLGNGVYRKLWK